MRIERCRAASCGIQIILAARAFSLGGGTGAAASRAVLAEEAEHLRRVRVEREFLIAREVGVVHAKQDGVGDESQQQSAWPVPS